MASFFVSSLLADAPFEPEEALFLRSPFLLALEEEVPLQVHLTKGTAQEFFLSLSEHSDLSFHQEATEQLGALNGQVSDGASAQRALQTISQPTATDFSKGKLPDACPSMDYAFSVESGYTSSEGIGYDKGYSTLGIFFSVPEYRMTMPFVQSKAHFFDDGKWAFNAGIGIRMREDQWNLVYGVHAFYDYRRFQKHNFNQAGFGLDVAGEYLTVRMNGYLPTGPKNLFNDYSFNRFSGHNLVLNKNFTLSMWGVDGEVEFRAPVHEGIKMLAAVGPYCYRGDFGKSAYGGKGKVYVNIWDYLLGGVRMSYDDVFHFNIQADVRLQVGFGPKSKSNRKSSRLSSSFCYSTELSLRERMVRSVDRQEIIVLSQESKPETAKDLYSSEDLFFYHVNNLSTAVGDGSFENPFSVLASAEAVSNANQAVYVNAGDGTTLNQTAGFTMKDNQMLLSSGTPHQVRSAQGFVPVPALTSGKLAAITNTADGIVLANNNIVEGFFLSTVTGRAIYATDQPVASAILNNRIIDPTTMAITIEYTAAFTGIVDGTWAVNGNYVTGTGGVEGIEMLTTGSGALTTDIDFSFNQIINTGSDAIHLIRTTSTSEWTLTGKINGNVLDGNGGEGIFIEGAAGAGFVSPRFQLQINNNRIVNNGADGIQLLRGTGFIEISGNTASSNGGTGGIFLEIQQSDSLRAVVNDNFLSDQGDTTHFETDGTSQLIMDFIGNTSVNGTITFDNNSTTDAQQIRFQDNAGQVDLQGVVTFLP